MGGSQDLFLLETNTKEMNKLLIVSFAATLLGLSYAANAQKEPKYFPYTGVTIYSNETLYDPRIHSDGEPVVITRPADGSGEEVNCNENPQRCRELLEEAADYDETVATEGNAEANKVEKKKWWQRKKKEGFMAEPGNVEDWEDLFKQMREGKSGPIFFPPGGGSGGPISGSPSQWTNQIIRTLK